MGSDHYPSGDGAALSRRTLIGALGGVAASTLLPELAAAARLANLSRFRTPHKIGRLVLAASGDAGAFDERAVDQPFVFKHDGRFFMTFVGYDGKGYQTGLAESDDLIHWKRTALILPRNPDDPVTRWNIATSSLLRENGLTSPGALLKVDGRYLCAWHAYPNAGYEEGPAVIGLAWSEDLIHWEREAPILQPDPDSTWEAGGLYKPWIMKEGDRYYIFYNAKTKAVPWKEQTGMAWSRDLKTWHRHPGNPLLRNGPPGAPDHRFASDPVVLKADKQWAMYYFGLGQDGKARELLALGDSLTGFTKVDEVLIDVGAHGTVDSVYAHKPAIISYAGDLYHYYCAVSGKWPDETRGISLARSRPFE
ncbi:putative GH43/DUF377 family glycosyl hydrolase [Sphingomonas zeicaulis]|uniref:glycoside hydrolase family 130 protein n=1 Tax=Sphingomonas zeicaulis TaxID=1632740 RepID=UPI003D1AB4CD